MENHDLKHDQAVIDDLVDKLNNAQYALDKTTGDRLKAENDFKIQVDNDAITVNRLKNEGIDLKHILADRNAEISNLRYILDMNRGKLKKLTDEFRINKDDNEYLKTVANDLDREVKIEVDVNNGLKRELDAINPRIKKLDSDIHNHNHRIDELENMNRVSCQNQDALNRDIDETVRRIRDASAQINVLEGKAKGLRIDNDHLEATIDDLRAKLNAETDLFNKLHADLGIELKRGDDLRNAHKRLVDSIEARRMEIDDLSREADELNDRIKDLTIINNDLDYQIAELTRHIDVLSKQNADLNNELTDIIMRDRMVREELIRRDGILDKQRANEENLKKSLSEVGFKSKVLAKKI